MSVYYKAVNLVGTSFHDPAFRWVPESGPVEGHVVRHRLARTQRVPKRSEPDRYLSVSSEPADCTGMRWPCRLLEVEPVDGYPVVTPEQIILPNKRAARAWRVVREVDATHALGPQGREVAALIERGAALTAGEARQLEAAWAAAMDAASPAAWSAARGAARGGALTAALAAALGAGRGAALAVALAAALGLVVRDRISREHYDTLTLPWRTTVGRIHPGDGEPDQ